MQNSKVPNHGDVVQQGPEQKHEKVQSQSQVVSQDLGEILQGLDKKDLVHDHDRSGNGQQNPAQDHHGAVTFLEVRELLVDPEVLRIGGGHRF